MGEQAELDETQGLKSWHYICEIPEFPLEYERSALVVIDLVYQQASRSHGMFKRLADAGLARDSAYAIDRIETKVVPNTARLIDAFREQRAPVIYTRCVSLRGDGSDQTRRHRAFGLVCAADSHDAQVLEELAPQPGDIMLDKTGSSFFNSTNAEHLLRNMGIATLVITGIWTNSCVEGTTRDAGDRDFDVVVVDDACAAMSPRGHRNALEYLDKNFCHVYSASETLRRLNR